MKDPREPLRDQLLAMVYGARKWRDHRFAKDPRVCTRCGCELTMRVREEFNYIVFVCQNCGNPFVVKKLGA